MDLVRPSQVRYVTTLTPSDGVREHEGRRLGTVRPPRVYMEASLQQTVDVVVDIRHFATLGKTLGINYARDRSI